MNYTALKEYHERDVVEKVEEIVENNEIGDDESIQEYKEALSHVVHDEFLAHKFLKDGQSRDDILYHSRIDESIADIKSESEDQSDFFDRMVFRALKHEALEAMEKIVNEKYGEKISVDIEIAIFGENSLDKIMHKERVELIIRKDKLSSDFLEDRIEDLAQKIVDRKKDKNVLSPECRFEVENYSLSFNS